MLIQHWEGLSPRARGNRDGGGRSADRGGSIPACAGEPHYLAMGWTPIQVYPRVRGGTGLDGVDAQPGRGLSPRARGNPIIRLVLIRIVGSIPACAGEPGVDRKGSGIVSGLSPRARGNPISRSLRSHRPRSIPACAGEPKIRDLACQGNEVYPRVRGGTIDERGNIQ